MIKRVLAILIVLVFSSVIISNQAVSSNSITQANPKAERANNDTETLCPVNNERMFEALIPIRYGLISPYVMDEKTVEGRAHTRLLREYFAAKSEQFPKTHRWINGGCILLDEKWETGYFCETCRRLESEWLAKHPQFRKRDLLP